MSNPLRSTMDAPIATRTHHQTREYRQLQSEVGAIASCCFAQILDE